MPRVKKKRSHKSPHGSAHHELQKPASEPPQSPPENDSSDDETDPYEAYLLDELDYLNAPEDEPLPFFSDHFADLVVANPRWRRRMIQVVRQNVDLLVPTFENPNLNWRDYGVESEAAKYAILYYAAKFKHLVYSLLTMKDCSYLVSQKSSVNPTKSGLTTVRHVPSGVDLLGFMVCQARPECDIAEPAYDDDCAKTGKMTIYLERWPVIIFGGFNRIVGDRLAGEEAVSGPIGEPTFSKSKRKLKLTSCDDKMKDDGPSSTMMKTARSTEDGNRILTA